MTHACASDNNLGVLVIGGFGWNFMQSSLQFAASCHCEEMAGDAETGILTVRRFCQQLGFKPIDFINQGKSQ